MSFSIAGKTAIITGAANGIGLAIARHFADEGANVMFADIDEQHLVKEVKDLPDNMNARHFAGDLRERLTIANLLSATMDAFDSIDILVNACRQVSLTDPLDPADQSIKAMLEQNLMVAAQLSQMVALRMVARQGGSASASAGVIVNLSSIAAQRAHPKLLGYSVATAALDQLTRSLAVALAPHRIRVNAIAFGSAMSASLQAVLKDDRACRAEIEQHTPLGRIAAGGELAEAVQFLASEASGFMTGQIITLDGGRALLDTVRTAAH
ncbi:MAG: SDR family oxidoreductase [Rhodobacteraceae bacterium]|nr:SDR family oxidoreductase [Paracoccaceae bacterium]